MIDLASDTVTRPTPEMLSAMMQAQTGDDVFRLDPTVNQLEERAADMFGMEASLFCVSGTMTNQIGISLHTHPGAEVICHRLAHIYVYEGGGIMVNSGASVKLVGSDDGMMTADEVSKAINPDDIHFPVSRMVAIENTSNKGGGSCHDFAELEAIGAVAQQHHLALHLDGARLFNALVAREDTPAQYGGLFDTISVCLSKGLGCPVGSLLLGNRDMIREARRIRKRLGGGWRQAGFLAAAGIYALDHHIDRLQEDHDKASLLARCLNSQDWVESVLPVETNIVIARLASPQYSAALVAALQQQHIRISDLGQGQIRLVTHLDVSMEEIAEVCDRLADWRPV
ncbi:MAG: aminotransferase class I/II-fold pyridoxal phosphate-dependent enzyme [Pseudomonadales bacterium]|nr:aminotransferase class I/II-fold pyridoxal phosphate-dependent enzyme [Pseudomonadales bacterium]